MKTYYDILGLEPDCEAEAIKQAFRKLALTHHPDRNPDPMATETFHEIREAYETLSDPDLREEYDVFLVENSSDFVYVRAPEEPEASGPTRSGGKGFGQEDDGDSTPFMFLLWVIVPFLTAAIAIEFFDSPLLAAISIPVSVGVMLWIRSEIRDR